MKISFYRSRKVVVSKAIPLLAVNVGLTLPGMLASDYYVKIVLTIDFVFLSIFLYKLLKIKILDIIDGDIIIYSLFNKRKIKANEVREILITQRFFSKIILFSGETFFLPLFDLSDIEFEKVKIALSNFSRGV
ncbi:hypothetical protein KLP40_17300 [Hymenobacter sp. NST-14]|uniref:hypothetical protein n=1 Tax=Hymenobacter piscis TaxID=2839984 RepID=UPI001C0313D1|nr:hypothetical protein [Hymenobacter piscis]MBT9394926.1 hypothetical protein [Hymenobacter piscis]